MREILMPPAPFLLNEREIAGYIEAMSPNAIDVEFVEDRFFDSHAVLCKRSLASLKPGPAESHIQDSDKTARYARLPIETLPPIIIENDEILDGHHRYRRAQHETDSIWCYDIREGRDPDLVFLSLDYDGMADALSGKGVGADYRQVIGHWLEIKDVPYFNGLPWKKDDYHWMIALDVRHPVDQGVFKAIGLLELQRNPDDGAELWLKSVGVRETDRKRGVATGLVDEMVRVIQALKTQALVLKRSMASEDGARYIQATIDEKLDAAGITWTQSGRSDQRITMR